MKTKVTWKPTGLKAKRWREAGQTRGPANLIPPARVSQERVRRKSGAPPYAQKGS